MAVVGEEIVLDSLVHFANVSIKNDKATPFSGGMQDECWDGIGLKQGP